MLAAEVKRLSQHALTDPLIMLESRMSTTALGRRARAGATRRTPHTQSLSDCLHSVCSDRDRARLHAEEVSRIRSRAVARRWQDGIPDAILKKSRPSSTSRSTKR